MIRKLFTDSFSSVSVPLVKMVITFIMAPLIVRSLGNYDYGIWEVVFSIIAYMEFLDLGLQPAIVRNVARNKVLNDPIELNKIFSSSLVFFLPVGLLMSFGLLLFSIYAPEFFIKGPEAGGYKYTLFFIIISIQVFFGFVGSVFDCYLEGLQLYTVRNISTIVFSIVGSLILYYVLKNGGGLIALATVTACGYSLKYVLYGIILSNRKYGGFKFRLQDVSKETLRGLFSFGFKSFIWALSLRTSTLTDPMIIGAYLGAAIVPFYMIPSNFIGQARGILWSVTRVFLPVFSGLDALDELDKTRKLYLGASRFMLGILVPIVGGICLLGPSFIEHWMGREYADKGTYVLYIIVAAHVVQWMNPFSRRLFTAVDKHEVLARTGMIGSLVNLCLSFILVQYIGIEGVALGTLLPLLLAEPYLLVKTCQILKSSIAQYSFQVFMPLVIPAIIFIYILKTFISLWPVKSISDVFLLGTGALLIYVPFFVSIAMKQDERQKVCTEIKIKLNLYLGT